MLSVCSRPQTWLFLISRAINIRKTEQAKIDCSSFGSGSSAREESQQKINKPGMHQVFNGRNKQ